nr:hypothetical protein BaRGS_028552 [Batillaria attramentaria]
MYPDLRYIAMSTDNLNWDINGNKLRNAYDVLEEMDLLFFQLNPTEARQRTLRKASQIPGIRQLTWDDMNTVMKDCPRDLFPDREAVMAIEPEGYAGYDYLPTTYHKFVSGPGVTGYVYKKRGKVRSLDMYPDLRYTAMNTHNLNWDINGNKLRNAYHVLEEMDMLFFQLNPAEARQRTPRKASQIPGIRQLTWDDMNTVMKDCPRDLFPCGRIMINMYSYGIMEANTDLIYLQGDDREFMGSFHEPASEDWPKLTES